MSYVGSRKSAKEILDFYNARPIMNEIPQVRLPDGWEYLGAGAYRVAYLNVEQQVAYKVPRSGYTPKGYDSKAEVANCRRLYKILNGTSHGSVRIPLVSGYNFGENFVVAMQAIIGKMGRDANVSREKYRELDRLGLSDMHGGNFVIDDKGLVWPIDLASRLYINPNDFKV